MRVFLIFLLLIVLGLIGWQAAQRFGLVEPSEESTVEEADSSSDSEPAADRPAEAVLPNFDIVRVDRSGYAVIAGRAAPNAKVSIFANGELLIEGEADAGGAWALVTDTPLEKGSVELTLVMRTSDGLAVSSEQTVVIYVPENDGDAPLVLRTTLGGASEVLQDAGPAGEGLGPLALEVIDYDDSGAVIFAGRASPNSIVQLFINRQLLGQAQADGAGRWTLSPEAQIAPGVYTLIVVQLDDAGRPAFAIELPFERASADQVALIDGRVVVQPGNSLWRIARGVYGEGAQYTIIYQANADQIRDPDLIYPGQIFDVPEEPEASDGE